MKKIGNYEIDWNNPLAKHCVGFWLFTDGKPINLVKGKGVSNGSSDFYIQGSKLQSPSGQSSTDTVLAHEAIDRTIKGTSLVIKCKVDSIPNTYASIAATNLISGPLYGFAVGIQNSNRLYTYQSFDNHNYTGTKRINSFPIGGWATISASNNGLDGANNVHELILNGEIATSPADDYWRFGVGISAPNSYNGTRGDFVGEVECYTIFDKELPLEQLLSLNKDPYQILARVPSNDEIYTALFSVDAGGSHDLSAVNIEASTEVSSPAVGQVHALLPTHVEASTEVSSPAVGQEHALSATGVEASSEVSAPVLEDIGATHVLEAVDVESVSEVFNPSLGQVHALTVVSVEASSELSVPVVAQVHSLSAVSIESSSEVSNPVVVDIPAGTHVLTSISVEAISSVDAPALAENEVAYVDICTDDTPMIFGTYVWGTGTFGSVSQCDSPNPYGNNLCNTTWDSVDKSSDTWTIQTTSDSSWTKQRCG